MALCLLKSVDGLDPDKITRKLEVSICAIRLAITYTTQQPQYYMQSQMGQTGGSMVAHMPQGQADLEIQRKNFEFAMGNRPKYVTVIHL